jgi:hypothetical protein
VHSSFRFFVARFSLGQLCRICLGDDSFANPVEFIPGITLKMQASEHGHVVLSNGAGDNGRLNIHRTLSCRSLFGGGEKGRNLIKTRI